MSRRAIVAAMLALAVGLGVLVTPSRAPVAGTLAAKQTGPLFGVVMQRGVGQLVRLDPRTLRAIEGRRIRLGRNVASFRFSPDGARLVVALEQAGQRAALRFVDVRRMRRIADLPLGRGGALAAAWPVRDRLVVVHHDCCTPDLSVVVIDPSARRVVARTRIEHVSMLEAARTPSDFVAVLAPAGSIGPARLLVVDRAGTTRVVGIDRVSAGVTVVDHHGAEPLSRHSSPGLALDPDGRRAFVVPAAGPVAEVSLESLTVSYHDLARPVSLLGRLHNWIEPSAQAKVADGPTRHALWLGGGLVAVTGIDYSTYRNADGELRMKGRAAGLSILDTRDWSVRTVDSRVDFATRAGGGIVATGGDWTSESGPRVGIGLAGFGVDGAKRFALFEGTAATITALVGDRAWVHADGLPLRIVDVTTGRVIGLDRRRWLPQVLVDFP